MHRLTLGNFELTVISDGTYHLDGGAFFGVVPKSMWQKKVTPDDRNLVPTGLNSIVVRTGDKTILIETGIGNKLTEKMIKIYGQPAKLLENLAAAGISPEDIDIVINTHLHFDHCGWNTVLHGSTVVPTFPRAKYYAPEGEWQYARQPSERDAISYISANYDPLVTSGQMQLLKGDQEIVPGISVAVYPGHTRHMQAVILRSSRPATSPTSSPPPGTSTSPGACLSICFRSKPSPIRALLRPGNSQKWLTLFTHDPNTPWAYVEKDEKEKMVAS